MALCCYEDCEFCDVFDNCKCNCPCRDDCIGECLLGGVCSWIDFPPDEFAGCYPDPNPFEIDL